MPYKKKSYAKKRGHSRPGYVRCGKMVVSDASKALAMAKYLKGIVNVEYKLIDTLHSSVLMTVAPIITPLTNIVQGDSNVTRDGSNLKIVSIAWNYFIHMNSSATSTMTRVLLVHDKQTNQALFTGTDLLTDVSISDGINSFRNLDNSQRFHVLYDRRHAHSVAGNSRTTKGSFHKQVQYKIRYDANVGDITDLTMSSLSLVFFSNESTVTPTFNSFIRLRFIDN